MKRVLLLIKGLGRGGAEQLLADVTRYADRSSFEYEIAYLLPWKDALVKELRADGLTVHCLRGARGLGWASRLRSLVQRRRIDVVHSHSPVAAVGARVALTGMSTRHVYTEHNDWARYHPVTRWVNLATYGGNEHVFAVSDHVRDSIRQPRWLPGGPAPVETLYHGIDPASVASWTKVDGARAELGIGEGTPLVGTVANLKAHKRLDQLIRAMTEVREAVPAVRLVVVGHGPMEGALRALVARLHLEDVVVFAGYREDAQRIAASFDVFALTSEHEGLSIALIEALALGKPAVVTNVGGLLEVVRDDVEGLIVPVGDRHALTQTLIRLLLDPELRFRLGRQARSRAREFDIRRAVRRIEQVYEEVLS
jgi:glycosyltransferase involved in cell wall biosynthesis